MKFIDELKAKSNQAHETKIEVIEEIKNYFNEYLNSEQFESDLKRRIGRTEIEERKVRCFVAFREYMSGCGTTRFSLDGYRWLNPEHNEGYESTRYKNLELAKLQFEVCNHLESRLFFKMKELGFTYLYQEDCKNRFEFFDRNYYFGW